MPGTVIPYNRINPTISPADVLVLGLARGCHEETFVVTDAYCIDPDCDCHLATLRLSELLEDGSPDPEPLDFHLHLETLELLELNGTPLAPETGSLLHSFRSNLPEEGLALWKKHALEAKTWGQEHAWEVADFSELEPGEMLTPSRLWPETPEVTVKLGETTYVGLDYYCPSPTCDCQEVRLDLVPEGATDPEAPDTIRLDLRWEFKGQLHLEEAVGIAPQTLKPLLRSLGQDKALLTLYRERYSRIKGAGKVLAGRYPALAQAWGMRSAPKATPVSVPKVGRNDPCPCGSGKKFKQCCGK